MTNTHNIGAPSEPSRPVSGLTFDVTVEIPKGNKNKYEVDHETGRIRLDRTLFTSTSYPADYGFIEGTLGQDGDPLDALVLVSEPTFPGCLIKCRAVAMFRMTDEAGGDDKVLCVPAGDMRRDHVTDVSDVRPYLLLEIEHFFTVYKDLEPGKSVEGASWTGAQDAEDEVRASFDRAKEHGPLSTDSGSSGPIPGRYLITGVSRGIGAEVARQLRSAGHLVYGVVRTADPAVIGDLAGYGLADLSEPAEVGIRLADLAATLPSLDGLLHSAGIARGGALARTTAADLSDQLTVNVTSVAEVDRVFLPALRAGAQGRGGTVVYLNSGSGSGRAPPAGRVRRQQARAARVRRLVATGGAGHPGRQHLSRPGGDRHAARARRIRRHRLRPGEVSAHRDGRPGHHRHAHPAGRRRDHRPDAEHPVSYLILLAPSANRVYTERAVDLSVAELEIIGADLITAATPVEIAGIAYLEAESAHPEAEVLDVLGRLSTCWAVFARDGDRLRPLRRGDHDRFADDLVSIPKYPGKTNEQFTRLMINIAAASAPRLIAAASAPRLIAAASAPRLAEPAGPRAPSLLDPLCGRGTTLSLGLTLGFDVAGVDVDLKAIEAYAAFLKTYLRRKRIKHTAEMSPVRRDGKSIGRRFDAEITSPLDDRRSSSTIFSGDTRDSAALFGKRRFDLVVTDAPYGIVHGSRSGRSGRERSPSTLLDEAIGVWAGQLKTGGALALSWNTYGMSRESLSALAEESGLRPLEDGPYRRLAHRVDASIQRDLFVAVRD